VAYIFADPVAGEPGWHAIPRPCLVHTRRRCSAQ
jgi:hypothetical protein